MGRGILVADLSSEPRAACTSKRPFSLGARGRQLSSHFIGGGFRFSPGNEKKFNFCCFPQPKCNINDVISRTAPRNYSRRALPCAPKSPSSQTCACLV